MKFLLFALCVFLLSLPALAYNTNNPSQASINANDNAILQFALTLELLEANFYTLFLSRFSVQNWTTYGYGANGYNLINQFSQNENAHVVTLQQVLAGRGVTPVQACAAYNFNAFPGIGTLNTIFDYLRLAYVLENTGVSAYDATLPQLTDPGLQQLAATIATIEGRHASVIAALYNSNLLLNQSSGAFPAFDTPLPAMTVASAISALVYPYCLAQLVIPTTPVLYPTYNDTALTVPTNTTDPTAGDLSTNSLNDLNYALTLEYLEAKFYSYFLNYFRDRDFTAAGYGGLRDYITLIRLHEKAHVNTLVNTISANGGVPVKRCTYNFAGFTNITTVPGFLRAAYTLENTGVSAYDGAINRCNNRALRLLLGTIATVEARHAALLGLITNQTVIPNGNLDAAATPTTVISTVASLIVTCPYGTSLTAPITLTIPLQ